MVRAEGYCAGCQEYLDLEDGEYCTKDCRKIYQENPPFIV